jgi:hypothetical protein
MLRLKILKIRAGIYFIEIASYSTQKSFISLISLGYDFCIELLFCPCPPPSFGRKKGKISGGKGWFLPFRVKKRQFYAEVVFVKQNKRFVSRIGCESAHWLQNRLPVA